MVVALCMDFQLCSPSPGVQLVVWIEGHSERSQEQGRAQDDCVEAPAPDFGLSGRYQQVL
jgi:hypothetical protein